MKLRNLIITTLLVVSASNALTKEKPVFTENDLNIRIAGNTCEVYQRLAQVRNNGFPSDKSAETFVAAFMMVEAERHNMDVLDLINGCTTVLNELLVKAD